MFYVNISFNNINTVNKIHCMCAGNSVVSALKTTRWCLHLQTVSPGAGNTETNMTDSDFNRHPGII